VTQKDEVKLPIGQRVLVITGPQARIVADYTVEIAPPKPVEPPAPLVPPVVIAPKQPDEVPTSP